MKKQKTRTIAGIAITAMLIYGIVCLISATVRLNKIEQDNGRLISEISSAEKENRRLIKLISEAGTDESKQVLAEERFGLVRPGE